MRWFALVLGLAAQVNAAEPKVSVAVAYFDNNSADSSLDPLARGLADMLITDLSHVERLQLVEREKLNLALDELKLSKTKFVDPKTALKLGKGLAARYLLVGGYLVADETMRLDARLFDVPASKVLLSEKVEGKKAEFFALEKELVELLIQALELKLQLAEKSKVRAVSTENFDAFQRYSAGLAAKDAGDQEKARAHFAAALEADPNYRAARSATERLAVVFAKDDTDAVTAWDRKRAKLDPKAPDFAARVEELVREADETRTELFKRKIELLSWLGTKELFPSTMPGFSLLAMNALGVIGRHTADPSQWDKLPLACEFLIMKNPGDQSIRTRCRVELGVIEQLREQRALLQQKWDEERDADLRLPPDDWRVSLRKNESGIRALIALYASKVKK